MTSRSECPNCHDLELAFGSTDNGANADPRERFEVFDAECETVCYCPSLPIAEAVARALNASPDAKDHDLLVHCGPEHRAEWESSLTSNEDGGRIPAFSSQVANPFGRGATSISDAAARVAAEIEREVDGVFKNPEVLAAAWWFETHRVEDVSNSLRYVVQPLPFVPTDAYRAAFGASRGLGSATVRWVERKGAAT